MHILPPKFQRRSSIPFPSLAKRGSLHALPSHSQSLDPRPKFSLGKSDSRPSLKHNLDKNGKSDPKNPRKLGKQGRSPSWGMLGNVVNTQDGFLEIRAKRKQGELLILWDIFSLYLDYRHFLLLLFNG